LASWSLRFPRSFCLNVLQQLGSCLPFQTSLAGNRIRLAPSRSLGSTGRLEAVCGSWLADKSGSWLAAS
jgi:hypothetical protein